MGKENVESNLEIKEKPEIVEIPVPKSETTEEAPVVKQKRQYNKRKDKNQKSSNKEVSAESVESISSVLIAGFQIASLRLGEHWAISEQEANSVAKPLTKILDKYSLLSKAESVSDPVALIIATGALIVPRVIITTQSKALKTENIIEKNGGITNGKSSNNKPIEKVEKTSDVRSNQLATGISNEIQPTDNDSIKADCFSIPQ